LNRNFGQPLRLPTVSLYVLEPSLPSAPHDARASPTPKALPIHSWSAALRRVLARNINAALTPLGLEVRRRFTGGPGRPTLRAALQRLRALGFTPATVFDVGVAEGTEALYETFPTSQFVLIEPLREYAEDLDRIVKRLSRAEYVAAAASSRSGTLVLNVGFHTQLASRHDVIDRAFAADERREVNAITLDDIWQRRALQSPALIKIDVEGDELEVLRGAKSVLRHCEYILLEAAVGDVFAGAPRIEEVIHYLTERGFLLNDILQPAYSRNGNLQMVDLAFVPRNGRIRALTEVKS
jgi:FkbM family methyltransferase